MARIKTTAIVADIKGKLNGSVFQGNNGVLSLRQYAVPVNGGIMAKQKQRNNILYLQNAWRDLSTAERDSWNNYAKVLKKSTVKSSTVFLNGQSVFISINSNRLLLKEEILTTPNGYTLNIGEGSFTLRLDGNKLYLVAGDWITNDSYAFIVKLSRPVLPSCNYRMNEVKYIHVSWDMQLEFDITDSYINAFGSLPSEGSTLFMHVMGVSLQSNLSGMVYKTKQFIPIVPDVYADIQADTLGLWSLKKRIKNYSGYCLQVRKAISPFDTIDIPFGDNGLIDWSVYFAIPSYASYSVSKIYSQINSNDMNIVLQNNRGAEYNNGGLIIPSGIAAVFNDLTFTVNNGFAYHFDAFSNSPDSSMLLTYEDEASGFMYVDSSTGLNVDSGTLEFGFPLYASFNNKFSILNMASTGVFSVYSSDDFIGSISGLSGSNVWNRFGDVSVMAGGGSTYFGELLLVNRALTINEIQLLQTSKIF